eukprot:scaffold73740_cov39-Cyclotella_meneghiniana.AAC.3
MVLSKVLTLKSQLAPSPNRCNFDMIMMESRQRFFLCGWLTGLLTILLLQVLINNFSSLFGLIPDIDIDHPSLLDRASNNDSVVLECTFRDWKTKTTNVTHVNPREFYAEDSNCRHSFKEDTAFFHVGKAGGGTILEHLDERWGFAHFNWVNMSGFTLVHPGPKLSINKLFQNGPLRTLIFNVRDPVDRFVSAFNWRDAILCHPDDERHRENSSSLSAARFPNILCKEGYEKEEKMLRETYQSSPSVLAEALCHDSPLRPKAEQDFNKVLHSTTLTKWLHFLIDPRSVKNINDDGIQQFIVLPLEKRPGANVTLFEQHIDNLGYHLLSTRYGMDATKKMMRLAQEQKLKQEETRKGKMKDKSKDDLFLHSSAKFYNSTKSSTLTKLGECCLTRYLSDDYRLIQSMLGKDETSKIDFAIAGLDPLDDAHPIIQKACSWGDEQQQQSCRGDLMSILMRRAKYLDESKGSCSELSMLSS